MRRSRLREHARAMTQAETYDAWLEAAEAFDREAGLWEWRQEPESPLYHAALIEQQLIELRRLRHAGAVREALSTVHESMARNLGDLSAAALYETAFSGTKRLVTAYLDETIATLHWLGEPELPEVPALDRLAELELRYRSFGRSALMLSGGAGLGFYHLGVVRALLAEGLLPRVICGASTGAMIAAWVGSHADEELLEQYADPGELRFDGIAASPSLFAALHHRAILDQDHLYEVIRHNVGDVTFEEAHLRSGRSLNISLSPTRVRQQPTLLSHLTAPNVLVANAALASSALPALYRPVILMQRDHLGHVTPYIRTERWIDGSVNGDLPMQMVGRIHNVNHFIVSQANPHVAPFVRHQGRRGALALVAGVTTSTIRAQTAHAADIAGRLAVNPSMQQTTDRVYSLFTQPYRGDIDIFPPFRLRALGNLLRNPKPSDIRQFIRDGQRATWPLMTRIRDQARLRAAFESSIARLRAFVRKDASTNERQSEVP